MRHGASLDSLATFPVSTASTNLSNDAKAIKSAATRKVLPAGFRRPPLPASPTPYFIIHHQHSLSLFPFFLLHYHLPLSTSHFLLHLYFTINFQSLGPHPDHYSPHIFLLDLPTHFLRQLYSTMRFCSHSSFYLLHDHLPLSLSPPPHFGHPGLTRRHILSAQDDLTPPLPRRLGAKPATIIAKTAAAVAFASDGKKDWNTSVETAGTAIKDF